MSKKWIVPIAIYIGLLAACIIAVYAVPSVKGMLVKTYIAEYGSIDVNDEVSAFIVRDETVYVASQASTVNRLAEADKLVKAGTRVTELTPVESASSGDDSEKSPSGKYSDITAELGDSIKSTKNGKTKSAGYVSYYIDGAEAKLSIDSVDSLRYSDLKDLTSRKAVEAPSVSCAEGDPIFKIVKNAKWYLVYYVKNKAAEKYEIGDTVTIDADGSPVEVTVSRVDAGSRYTRIVLSCKIFFDGFFETRSLDTTVTVKHAEGLILHDSSIVETADGQKGVFVKNKLGEHIFTPVAVKADNGDECVAYADIYVDEGGNYVETISTYDEIISEPTEEDMAEL